MKKRILSLLLVLALFTGLFSPVSFAAADLEEVKLTVDQLDVGYYNNFALTGDIILHCANSDITKETKNLVDNKSNPFYWSKPYKFNDLKDYGGNVVPAILIDVANGGDGVAICGYEMFLRDYLDCVPYHFEIQATLSAGSSQWIKVFEDSNTSWDDDKYHCEFDEVTVYKVRILFYDIGDPDYAKDTAYGTLPADSTRFSLSEINLLAKRNATTTPTEPATEAPTQAPTEAPTEASTVAPTEAATRPVFTLPATEPATDAPTEVPTAAPTEAPTAAPTQENVATGTKDGFTYKVVNDEVIITGCDETVEGDITIPDTLGGYPVTAIGDDAFSDCDSLTSVTIPDSVTAIGDYAFLRCSGLTSITIPDSVTTIGSFAFSSCSSLTGITIPDGVTSIGESAFYYCGSLIGIWVEEGNANYSNDDCGVLFDKEKTELICAPGGLSGSYTIPDSVTSIGDYAFYDCYRLTSINIPDGVTTIGGSAFFLCGGLTSVVLPDSVTCIGIGAFMECYDLMSIIIPEGVTYIAGGVFSFCSRLTSITIPESVAYIGENAFEECNSLNDVYYEGTKPQWEQIRFYGGNEDLISANIHFTESPVEPTEPETEPTQPTEPETEPETEPTVAPTAPTIAYKKVYAPISMDGATPVLGYYQDVNNMTGAPIYYEYESGTVVGEEAAYIISGTEGSRGYTGWFLYNELVANGGTKVPAFYVELPSAVTFGALELMTDNDIWGGPLNFSIEAYNGTEWIEIVNDDDPRWSARNVYAKTYEFEEVTATAVRVLAYDLATMTGTAPSDADTETRFILDELTLFDVSEVAYEVEPTYDYDKVTLSAGDVLGVGYYDRGNMTQIVSHNSGNYSRLFDGDYSTYASSGGFQYQWLAGNNGNCSPAILLQTFKKGQPARINGIELAVREDGCCAPCDFEIQVTTSETEDNWTTVVAVEGADWRAKNVKMYKLEEMEIYKLRLVCSMLTPNRYISAEDWVGTTTTYLNISELSLCYIYEDGNERPVTPPTEPTEAPTEPDAPVEGYITGDYLELIPESSLIPYVGDYINGDFENLVNQYPGEAAYLTDVAISSAGWIGSASTSGVQAAVIELGGTKKIGGVELMARTYDYLETFEIQVRKPNGTWETVKIVTENPFGNTRSVLLTFDAVEATAVRVLCYSWSSSRPMLQEISIYEVKTGTILQEVIPAGVTSPQGALTGAIENVIDGARGNYTSDYFQTTSIPTEVTFDLTKDGAPSNVARMVLYAYATNRYAPAAIRLELQVDGSWTTVYNDIAYENGAEDTFILDFDQAYDATAARLTVISTVAQELILTEVDFFGYVPEPTEPIDEYWYLTYEIVDGEAVITDCDESVEGSITIPDTLGGYPVTAIGDNAFSGCAGVKKITISDSVVSVADNAFDGCAIKEIVIAPGSKTITAAMIMCKDTLEKVVIPDSVTSIGASAFANCTSLAEITIPESVTSIGEKAFYYCCGTAKMVVPESVTSFGSAAFTGCGILAKLTIPEGVPGIAKNGLVDCTGLKEIVLPASVVRLGDNAFAGCTSLTKVTLSDGITTVGTGVFADSNIREVVVASGSKTITSEMIIRKNTLETIVIPETVTSIGANAFENCENLTDVYYGGTQEQWEEVTINTGNEYLTSAIIHFVDPWYLTYEIVDGEAIITDCDTSVEGDITIPDTLGGYPVTAIGSNAFRWCRSLASITIPEGVTSIGDDAFNMCTSLTSITIPDSVTSIGNEAFYDCDSLTSITIPDSVTSIDGVFDGCFNLTSVIIGDGVTSIGYDAFFDCSRLTSVTIGDGVTSIGDNALIYSSSLTGIWVSENNPKYSSDANGVLFDKEQTTLICVPRGISGSYTIPDGVTSIGNHAFFCCSSLTSVTIPDSVTSIGNSAFYSCSSLTSITIPASVTSIGGSAFESCSSLTSVTIPDSVTSIGNSAFYNCDSLTSITIPDSVTSIGSSAFESCSGLTSITIPEGVTNIGGDTFRSCDSLTSITIPASVTSIHGGAFTHCENVAEVYYGGTEEQWEQISFGVTELASANIYYKYTKPIEGPWYLTCGLVNGEVIIISCDISIEEDVVLPDTVGGYPVTMIDDNAFRNCFGITEITIPDSVTTIGDTAFQDCESLTAVNIPNGVTSIGSNAFDGCTSLNYNQYDNAYYLGNAENPYFVLVKATSAKASSCKVHKDTQFIYSGAFQNCSNMISITILNNVTWIGEGAFSGCNGLREVYYAGTESQWEQIVIEEGNECLTSATLHYEKEGVVIVETNALAGVSFSVRLIEPWAMRATVTYYQGQQPNQKKLTLSSLKNYGVYAILGSKFENAENATLEDLLNDPDTIHFEMAASAEEGKIYPINATQAQFDFYDGLYTYRLNEAVYMVTYYEDADGMHFSRVRSKTLVETMDGLSGVGEKESNVYTSMKAMEASVTAYRATLPSSALGTVYPAGLSVAESGIPFGADPAPGSYKFGTSVSIKLIEPWGIKADIRIVNSSNQNINYSNADDYGMIFFHDKDGKYADTGMTADDILAEAGAQVYANSLGNVTLANSRMTAIYDQGIFTYQMDSTLYCMPFVVINGQYYYRNTGAISWNLIAQVEKFAGETTRSAEEIAVYNAMISMNENILIYRGQ